MEKEEVLAMSRKEKTDEGLVAVENRGRRLGIVAISIVLLVMMVINFIAGESNFGLLALYLSFLAADTYPRYRFTRNSSYLISAILCAVATLCCLTAYGVSVLL